MSAAVPLTTPAGAGDTIVELRGAGKRFAGVQALHEIDLHVRRGTIHALVGENGAGKSTLGKLVAGVLPPDDGLLLVDGAPVSYSSPHDALRDGIAAIQQEIALVPARTVIENVFLGIESTRFGSVDRSELRRRYDALRELSGFHIDPAAKVATLRLADQQKVEVLRAMARDARLIVMDEPTAALTPDETAVLLDVARGLRDRGVTIIYVSHFLEEVLRLADTVTVLRNGRLVRTAPSSAETADSLVEAMLGRSLEQAFPAKREPPADADVVLRAHGLTRTGVLADVSLELRRGEIVGMAGLVGSGRSEVARAIFGADALDAGRIELHGRTLALRGPADAIAAGIAMLPESRKDLGLLMRRNVGENASLVRLREVSRLGIIARRRENAKVDGLLGQLDVRPRRRSIDISLLSGGNQQKVLFAKWLFRRPEVLIVDEPTRGVDVGAKFAIYELIASLAEEGVAVLVISSELEEVLGLAHRVLVMRRGRVVANLRGESATEDGVMRAAFGTASVGATPGGVQ